MISGSWVAVTDVVQLATGVPRKTWALNCDVLLELPRCSISISFQSQFG